MLGNDATGGVDAVHPRHVHVHDHDVGPRLPGDDDDVVAGACLAHDLYIGTGPEQHAHPVTHDRMVIGHRHAIGPSLMARQPPAAAGR